MQGVNTKYRGIAHAFSTILKEEGYRAFWKGNWSAEYLYLGYGAIQFVVFEKLKEFFAAREMPASQVSFFAGGLAGTLSTTITYPFDLLRTRFAMQGNNPLYFSIKQAISHIYLHEGFRGFYLGLLPTILQIFPYMGLAFASHDYANRFLQVISN